MRNFFILLIQSLFVLIALTVSASAGVFVFDDIVPVNKPVKLKALTKGRFFPEGGKLVTFYADGKKIGTTLSGGDGIAFLKYTHFSPGLITLEVEAGRHTNEGVILVTGKKDKVILIEIERTLFESVFSLKPAKDSNKILHELSKKFRIIYMTTLAGVKQSRKWLKENNFPLSPVLKWDGSVIRYDLRDRGIKLHAIIASPAMLSEAPDIDKRFSFDETEDAIVVKGWPDLLNKLK